MSGEWWPTRLWRWLCWALDWECPSGEPDFAKMMQAATQVAMLLLLWREKPISAALCLILVASSHGTRVVMALIKARTFASQSIDTRIQTITESREPDARRDDERG